MITHCSFDEVFTWSDGKESSITVTGDDFWEYEMPVWTEELAQKELYEEYNDWIAGTEPDGWVDDAVAIRIDGWFFDFETNTYEFASIDVKKGGK